MPVEKDSCGDGAVSSKAILSFVCLWGKSAPGEFERERRAAREGEKGLGRRHGCRDQYFSFTMSRFTLTYVLPVQIAFSTAVTGGSRGWRP